MHKETIGKATLYLGDCREGMAGMSDKSFSLAIVDPPYGRGEDGGTDRCSKVKQKNGTRLQCLDGGYKKKDWDKEPPPPEYFTDLQRVSQHQIIWGVNYYPVALPGGRIIWDKVNDGSDQSGAEIAYNSLNQRVDVVRYMWRGMMQGVSVRRGTVQQGNKALNEKRVHPTQKPVKLYGWLLDTYAKPGQTIIDTHFGSGSLVVAALERGFDVTAYEIDPEYFEAACIRIEQSLQQLQLAL